MGDRMPSVRTRQQTITTAIRKVDANWQRDRRRTPTYEFSNGKKFDEPTDQRGIYHPDNNRPPTNISLSATSVDKLGGTVGTISGSDPESQALTFSVVRQWPSPIEPGTGSDVGRFSVSGTDLLYTRSLAGTYTGSVRVRLRATDTGGLTYDEDFVVSITG